MKFESYVATGWPTLFWVVRKQSHSARRMTLFYPENNCRHNFYLPLDLSDIMWKHIVLEKDNFSKGGYDFKSGFDFQTEF